LERVDYWRLKNAGKHEQHVQDQQTVLAEREQRLEENRNVSSCIINAQIQIEASTANCSTEKEESEQPTGDDVREKENKDGETECGIEGMGESGSANKKAVVKAIEEMTIEEFKEIKRGRGRLTKDEKKKKKNTQLK